MSEKSGFFNFIRDANGKPDRSYPAEEFARYFALFIKSGVFAKPANQLQVVAKNGLTVTVKAGTAFIHGYWYILDEDKDITFAVNTGTSVNICQVICEYSVADRIIQTKARNNAINGLPEDENELVLCTINLQPNATSITQGMITDRRPDDNYCGFVTGLVDQIDIETLLVQFKEQFSEYMTDRMESFDTWYQTIQNILSGDVAGNLLELIEERAPVYHASSEPDYGIGTGEKYGHVKVSNKYPAGHNFSNEQGVAVSRLLLERTMNNLLKNLLIFSGYTKSREVTKGWNYVLFKLSELNLTSYNLPDIDYLIPIVIADNKFWATKGGYNLEDSLYPISCWWNRQSDGDHVLAVQVYSQYMGTTWMNFKIIFMNIYPYLQSFDEEDDIT